MWFKILNFRFGIKSAILGGAVYYTIDKGMWKDSSTTNAIYEDLEKGISPYVGELKNKIPYEVLMTIFTVFLTSAMLNLYYCFELIF